MSLAIKRAAVGALFAVVTFATPALAHEVTVGSLTLTDLWTRATPPKAPTAAGYLTITNKGAEADRLIAATTPDAAKGELHIMQVKDGVMTMRPAEGGIAIPAGGSVTLAPGGYHLMFITLKDSLKEGGKLPVTLTFEKAGKVDTFLHVLAVGAQGPAGGATHDMGSMNMNNSKGTTPMTTLRAIRLAVWVAVVVLVAAMVWIFVLQQRGSVPGITAASIGGPFTLTDQTGKTVTEADLQGHPSALFFGYTYCPDVCPTTLADMTLWLQDLGADADKLKVYFITVDPERDTQTVMADYLAGVRLRASSA